MEATTIPLTVPFHLVWETYRRRLRKCYRAPISSWWRYDCDDLVGGRRQIEKWDACEPSDGSIEPSDRSKMIAKVRAADTKPERIVRRAAHRIGLRFRLHRRDLPGTPDLILPRHNLVIFVHGCLWHRHEDVTGHRSPPRKSNFRPANFTTTWNGIARRLPHWRPLDGGLP